MTDIRQDDSQSIIRCMGYISQYYNTPQLDFSGYTSSSMDVIQNLISYCKDSGLEMQYRNTNYRLIKSENLYPLIVQIDNNFFVLTSDAESEAINSINNGIRQVELINILDNRVQKSGFISFQLESKGQFNIKEKAFQLINNYYPSCYAAGITGSFAQGKSNIKSDIDIIIISELVSEICSEIYYFNTSIFDVYVYPKNHLGRLFNYDIHYRKGILLDMFRKILVLQDTSDFLATIKAKAIYLYDIGPSTFDHKTFKDIRSKISNDLSDLKGNLSREKNIMVVIKTVASIVDFHSLINRAWVPVGKHIPLFFAERYPDFNAQLFSSLEKFYHKDDLTELILLIEQLINHSDMIAPKRSNLNVLNEYGSNFTIGISGLDDPSIFIGLIIRPLVSELDNPNFFFFKNNNYNYSGINYFITFFNSKYTKTFLDQKINLIKRSLNGKELNIRFLYPYNLLDIAYLNYTDIPVFANNYFGRLSNLYLISQSEQWVASNTIQFAIKFNQELIRQNNISKSISIKFYKFILEDWLSSSFEYKNYNYLQVKELIQSKLTQFEEMYRKQNLTINQSYWASVEQWTINFDSFAKADVHKADSFYLFKHLNLAKIDNEMDLEKLYIYKLVIGYFFDLLSINRAMKCYLMYIYLKEAEE